MGRMISVDKKSIKKFIFKVANDNIPFEYFFLSEKDGCHFTRVSGKAHDL